MKNIKSRFRAVWLKLAMAIVAAAVAAPAEAQIATTRGSRTHAQVYGSQPGTREYAYQIGQERGYQEGWNVGRNDRSYGTTDRRGRGRGRGNKNRPANDEAGYDRGMGPKGQYKKGYRDGYSRGYQDGWNGTQSQYPNAGGYPNYPNYPGGGNYPNTQLARVASDNGFRDGEYYGQQDRAANRASRPMDTKGYQDADRGYSNSLGSKSEFQRIYRDAFTQGYNRGYGGTYGGGWPGTGTVYPGGGGNYPNTQLGRVASENGFRDGQYYGQQDRAANRASRPTDAKGYRDADHGYTSSLGSKSEFQQIYRQAFTDGYNRAYSGGYGTGYPSGAGYPTGGYPDSPPPGGGTTFPTSGSAGGVYPGQGGYPDMPLVRAAQQNGYSAGLHYGRQDRAERRSSNPTDAKGYKEADQGYSRDLGSKTDYQRLFRESFIAGYNDGWSGRR